MEPVSLKKVFAVVVACTAGGFLVNANEAPVELKPVKAATSTQQHLATFKQLLKANDSDNNGLLSQKELEGLLDTSVLSAFSKIDKNGDQAISEEEFMQYLGTNDVK